MIRRLLLLAAAAAPALALRAPPDVHITAAIPSLVAQSGGIGAHSRGPVHWGTYNASQPMTGEFGPWFPQTMHVHPSGALLLSYQTSPDTLDELGWLGQHFSSIDGGHTWEPIEMTHSPLHVKPCVAQEDGSLLCMEYAMRRTPNTHLGYFRSQIINADPKTGHLVQTGILNSTVNGLDQNFSLWPSPLCPEKRPCASNTSWQMVTDGNALPLGVDAERGHIMMMYGGTGPGWMNVSAPQLLTLMVVKSTDRGRSWTYFSTPEQITSKADAATKVPCEQPTENHMTTLKNGSVFAVFRSENTNYPLCSTVSNDEGKTWSKAVTMPGPTGRNPTTIHSSGAPAMSDGPFGVEPKILKLPNGLLVLSTGRLGQFLWVADDPPQAWTSWNVAKHHNDNFVKGAPPGGEAIYHNLTFFDESDGPTHWREREDFPRSGRAPPLSWNAAGSGTTAYTGMANIPGTNDVVICYDKNGHAWAPYPGDGDKSAVFTVRVTIERVVGYSSEYEHVVP